MGNVEELGVELPPLRKERDRVEALSYGGW